VSSAAWHTTLVSRWGEQILSGDPPGKNRHQAVYKRMCKVLDAAGLPYQSYRESRRGHAV
jgi:hypothetical protein